MTREGTEEDGVDEAGRSTEPPLTMAPPRREGAPEADGEVTAAPSGIMAPPPKVNVGKAENGRPAERDEVPFPADDIGQSQAPADADDTHAKTERADEKAARAAKGAGKADAAAGKADGAAGKVGGAAAQDSGDGAAPSRGGNGAGMLEGGLQTVKQAVAATNNWFANRVARTEPTVAGTGEAGSERRAGAGDRDGAAVHAETADVHGETAASGGERDESDRPPKWQDPYPAYSTPPSSARTAPVAPEAPRTSPLGAAPLGSGSLESRPDPGSRPASRGWTARPSGGASAKRQKASSARRSRRQAHLTVARVEPWSVMKFSFVVSVVAFIILFVAIAILYGVLSSIGVFESLQRVVNSVTSSQNSAGANVTKWFSASRVLGYTGLLGSLNIVLITAMSTIGAVIYNLISRVFGGVEITLRETE